LETTAATLPFLEAGKLRALAVGTDSRLPNMPNVPAIAEFLPGFEATAWGMFLVPEGTPPAITKRLATEFEALNNSPVIKKKLEDLGMFASNRSHAQLKPFMERELATWGKAVEVSGATVD